MELALTEIEGARVFGASGAELGEVRRVLFHPSEPRAIGFAVLPPAVGGVLKRPESFVGLASAEPSGGGLRLSLDKLPSPSKGAEQLGSDPESTVVYSNMTLAGADGREIGRIAEVLFESRDGSIVDMRASAGTAADAAHGRFAVPGDAVVGFREGAVRSTLSASEIETTGGVAKHAGVAAVVVGEGAEKAGRAVEGAAVRASKATGRVVGRALDGGVGRKAAGAWKGLTDAFREGYSSEDDKK